MQQYRRTAQQIIAAVDSTGLESKGLHHAVLNALRSSGYNIRARQNAGPALDSGYAYLRRNCASWRASAAAVVLDILSRLGDGAPAILIHGLGGGSWRSRCVGLSPP